MSALQDKYKTLIDTAKNSGVSNLQVREQDNVLYIDGDAPSASVKDKLWSVYNQADPDYKSGDVVLNVNATAASGSRARWRSASSDRARSSSGRSIRSTAPSRSRRAPRRRRTAGRNRSATGRAGRRCASKPSPARSAAR